MTVGIVNVAESMELAQSMGGYPLEDDFLSVLLCLSTLMFINFINLTSWNFRNLLSNFITYLQLMLLCYGNLKFVEFN